MASEVIDATAVVVHEESAPSLFGTSNPKEHIEKAVEHAKALKAVVEQRGLIADIQGKKYVLYDGWALLASMVGASIVEEWTKPLPDGNGWEARMLVMRNGLVIGAAENMCTRDEKRWSKADEYAIRSMAQTRAGGKAARTCLGFIVQLAGYEATPFDEMPVERDMLDPKGRASTDAGWAPPSPTPPCPEHGTKQIRYQKAGTSKASGKPYSAFYACDVKPCANGKGGKNWSMFEDEWQTQLNLARGDAKPDTRTTADMDVAYNE